MALEERHVTQKRCGIRHRLSIIAGSLSLVVRHANPPTDGAFRSEQILSIVDKEG